jgi:hypothetical protein
MVPVNYIIKDNLRAQLLDYLGTATPFAGANEYTRVVSALISDCRGNIAQAIHSRPSFTAQEYVDIVERENHLAEARLLFPEDKDPDLVTEQALQGELQVLSNEVIHSDYSSFLRDYASPPLFEGEKFQSALYREHKEAIDDAYLAEVTSYLRSDSDGLIDESAARHSIRVFESLLLVETLVDQANELIDHMKELVTKEQGPVKKKPAFDTPDTLINGTLKAFTDGLEAKKSTAEEIEAAPAFRKVLIAVEDGVLDKVTDFARNFYRSEDDVEPRRKLSKEALKQIVNTVKIQALREIYRDYTTDGQQLQAGVLPRHREVLASSYAEYLRKNHLLDEKGRVEAAQYYPYKETIDAAFKNSTTSESPENEITAFENYLKTLSIAKASQAVTEEWNTQTWLVGKSTEKLVVGTDTGRQWKNN